MFRIYAFTVKTDMVYSHAIWNFLAIIKFPSEAVCVL